MSTNGKWETPADPLEQRLKRYSTAKTNAKALLEFLAIGGANTEAADRGQKLADCASWLLFRRRISDASTHLYAAPFCQQPLLCQACAIRRAARSLQAYVPKILEARSAEPGRAALFVTFTVKNGDLKPQVDALFKALNRLTSRCRKSKSTGRRRLTQMSGVAGGVGSVEVKRGKNSNAWHPHYHGIWLIDDRIDWKKLKAEWSSILGYDAVAWFKYLNSERKDHNSIADHKAALAADLVEVFKYPMKFSELTPADQWGAFKTLAGSRLLRSFGCLRGITVDPSLLDAPISWDDEPFEELFFRYLAGSYVHAAAPSVDHFLKAWNEAQTAVSEIPKT